MTAFVPKEFIKNNDNNNGTLENQEKPFGPAAAAAVNDGGEQL